MFSNILLPVVLIVEARKNMDANTLINYLKGTLGQSRSGEVERWINESVENRKTAEQLYVLHFVGDRLQAFDDVNVDDKYVEFARKHISSLSRRRRANFPFIAKIASVAAIGVVFLISVFFSTLFLMDENAEPITVATNLGERSHLTLPDGTEVWLNAFSNLQYKRSFLSRNRKVTLSGEAYFEVAHDKRLPFVVMSNDTKIRVLGTKFNMRTNSDEDFSSTTLMDGSVEFSAGNNHSATVLKPGEELIYNKETRQVTVRKIDTPNDKVSWKDGILFFENSSLEEICRSLERNFNVNIIFADETLKGERFNAEFKVSDNIYQILSILELTNKFKLNIENRNITILPIK